MKAKILTDFQICINVSLIISNEEIGGIRKIVKFFEESTLMIKVCKETEIKCKRTKRWISQYFIR